MALFLGRERFMTTTSSLSCLEPSFALIAPKDLVAEPDFLLRYCVEDERLTNMVKRFNVIQPIFAIEKGGGKFQIVSGYKRFFAASRIDLKSVPVWWIRSGVLSSKELFKIALVLNVSSCLEEIDRVVMVARAVDQYSFRWDEMEKLAELFGMPPSRKVFEEYYAISKFPDEMKKAIYEGRLHFKAARSLIEINPEERKSLMRDVFMPCEFSASESEEIIEWLSDMARIEKTDIQGILCKEFLKEVLLSHAVESREKGKQFHRLLRTAHFPLYSSWEGKFQGVKKKLETERDLTLEKTPFFEGESLTLKLKVDSPEKLHILIRHLARNEMLFKNLFDLVQ